MKKSQYTDSQILAILKQNEGGAKVANLCPDHGMSEATFCKWRSRFGGMNAALMKRMKQLEKENRRIQRLVAFRQDSSWRRRKTLLLKTIINGRLPRQ